MLAKTSEGIDEFGDFLNEAAGTIKLVDSYRFAMAESQIASVEKKLTTAIAEITNAEKAAEEAGKKGRFSKFLQHTFFSYIGTFLERAQKNWKKVSLDKLIGTADQERIQQRPASSKTFRRNTTPDLGKHNVLADVADFDSTSDSNARDPARKNRVADSVTSYG